MGYVLYLDDCKGCDFTGIDINYKTGCELLPYLTFYASKIKECEQPFLENEETDDCIYYNLENKEFYTFKKGKYTPYDN